MKHEKNTAATEHYEFKEGEALEKEAKASRLTELESRINEL